MVRTSLFTAVLTLCLGTLQAQFGLPSYHQVTKAFFSNYQWEYEGKDFLSFARMKDGWHIITVDTLERISVNYPYWLTGDTAWRPLNGFEKAVPGYDSSAALEWFLGVSPGPNYNYQTIHYYGYPGWAEDMLAEYGHRKNLNDNLKESVARTCSILADRYLWNNYGEASNTTDTLQQPLAWNQVPGEARQRKMLEYSYRAIGLYKEIEQHNPAYETLLGPAAFKRFAEEFHLYMMLKLMKNDLLADSLLRQITLPEALLTVAENFMTSCPKNALLFTIGDNDTYPLLYIQAVKNFRSDLVIINTSLAGSAVHASNMQTRYKGLISTPAGFYGGKSISYILLEDGSDKKNMALSFGQFQKNILLQKIQPGRKKDDNWISSKYRPGFIPVNSTQFSKVNNIRTTGSRIPCITGNYLVTGDFLVLDMISGNIDKRPVCFTDIYGLFPESAFVKQGLVYRLLPGIAGKDAAQAIMQQTLQFEKQYRPIAEISGSKYTSGNIADNHFALYSHIISYYLKMKNNRSAMAYANKCLQSFADENYYWCQSQREFCILLHELKHPMAEKLLHHFCSGMIAQMSSSHYPPSYKMREWAVSTFEVMKSEMDSKGLNTQIIDKYLFELR